MRPTTFIVALVAVVLVGCVTGGPVLPEDRCGSFEECDRLYRLQQRWRLWDDR